MTMIHSHALPYVASVLLACGAVACSSSKSTSSGGSSPSGSEVAVSVVSGALNNNSGSGVALNTRAPKRSPLQRALAAMSPIGTASAAEWSCTGDTLSPAFSGSAGDPYSFTPPSCTVKWLTDKEASSTWSGPFTLNYGPSCDSTHPFMENQLAGCEMTRTSGASGDTRTITGPDGNSYAIDHYTNGEGTGWDSTVTPAPNNGGVEITCGGSGCAASRTLVVNGSHLKGTVTIDGDSTKIWDHTVSTGAGGMTVEGAGAARVVSGTAIVQHDLLQYTSTTTFASVAYGEPLCCFPTSGRVTTTFSKGADVGKTESIAFSAICGEATLTKPNGTVEAITLQHCL